MLCGFCALAGLAAALALPWIGWRNDEYLFLLGALVLYGTWGFVHFRAQARRAVRSRPLIALDISLRRQGSRPLQVTGQVRFDAAAIAFARGAKWEAETRIEKVKPGRAGLMYIRLAGDRGLLQLRPDEARGKFRLGCEVRDPLPARIRCALVLTMDGMPLYGMPLEFAPEIATQLEMEARN
jgi:hypothetical protein